MSTNKHEIHEEILETLAESHIPIKPMVSDKLFVDGGEPQEMDPKKFAELRKFTALVDTIKMPADQVKIIKESMKKNYALFKKEYEAEGRKFLEMTSKELFERSAQTSKKLCLINLGPQAGYAAFSLEVLNSNDLLCYGGVMYLRSNTFAANHNYCIQLPTWSEDQPVISVDGQEFRGMCVHLNHAYSNKTLEAEFEFDNNDPKIKSMARSTFDEQYVWLTDLEIMWPALKVTRDNIPKRTFQSYDYGSGYWLEHAPILCDWQGKAIFGLTLKTKEECESQTKPLIFSTNFANPKPQDQNLSVHSQNTPVQEPAKPENKLEQKKP